VDLKDLLAEMQASLMVVEVVVPAPLEQIMEQAEVV
jgi:hypothetical protein